MKLHTAALAFAASAILAQPAQPPVMLPGAPIDRTGFRFAREIPGGEPGLTSLLVDASVLAHAREDLGDIRIADQSNRQVPYLLEKRTGPLRLDLTYPRPKGQIHDQVSVYEIRLPYESFPDKTHLILETESRVFERNVEIVVPARSGTREEERVLARATWRHTDPQSAAPALDLPVAIKGVSLLEVRIDEGDNAPISLRPAALNLPSYHLRFFYPEEGRLTLLYGNESLPPPKYDLALLSASLQGAATQELTARPEQSHTIPVETRSRAVFWIILGAAAVVLIGLLARLLHQPAVEDRG